MKFARYLEETQTPEWKKAYIDYRGLKKRITAIRRAQEQAADGSTPLLLHATPTLDTHDVQTRSGHGDGHDPLTLSPRESVTDVERETDGQSAYGEPDIEQKLEAHRVDAQRNEEQRQAVQFDPPEPPRATPSPHPSQREPSESGQRPGILRSATLNMGFIPRLRRGSVAGKYWEPSRNNGKPALRWDLARSIPLRDLIPMLSQVHRAFFEKLDSELDKIETFYLEREKEMRARTSTLKIQLQELKDHRRLFHEAHGTAHSWLPAVMRRRVGQPLQIASSNVARKRRAFKADPGSPRLVRQKSPVKDSKAMEEEIESAGTPPSVPVHESGDDHIGVAGATGSNSSSGQEDVPKGWKRVRYNFQKHKVSTEKSVPTLAKYDPEDYGHAKKKLKKAVLECYRGLEVLENYRTLNLIGFRKALKKFEKCTKIPAQQAYFTEKIEPSAFSSGSTVQGMLSEMESLYAARFTRGDNKLAKTRLRGLAQHKTHHFSTFRTGLLLGLAFPAFIDGLYLSLQSDTLQAIPGRDGLLFVYAIFVVPVIFSLLVGLNILVWSRSRINYVFIFELDVKTRLDHREYFEIPALLLSTLCYAFWLSFARIGTSHFSPTLWPLIWLALVAVVLFNPLPVLFKTSRFWLIRNVFRLLTSGMHRVEFADFWMGDQFCSLVFTLSNLYFVGCAYVHGFDENWGQCISTRNWGVPFVLAALPLLVRFVQSIKRWVDSRLITHLINGGKYGMGVVYYLVYFNWRHQGGGRGGPFALWCIFGTIYATYALSWDLLMDWSVMKPHAKYPLLRPNLLYTSHIPLYYFAIITNVLIRFIWVFYIPERGPNFIWRTFIAGMLEMLRRLQWNFYRLENEHLGNMDQYRVTREVPLPYSFDDAAHESDGDEEDHKSISSWRAKRQAAKSQATDDSSDGKVTEAGVGIHE